MNFDKLINDFCIGIVFILVKKKMGGGGHSWNIKEELSQTLKMCQMRELLTLNVPENKSKMLYSHNQNY